MRDVRASQVMPSRRQLVLEGRAIRSEAALHEALAELLGFFDGYGRNLDALWDVLSDQDLREVKESVELVWRDAEVFARGRPDYFLKVQRLFAKAPEVRLLIVP